MAPPPASKKLVNAPEACVDEMLAGMAKALPGLDLHAEHRLLLRRQEPGKPTGKVALLSGGGSGHEPFCAGYVGRGMLSATVAGSVFASPPPSHVLYGVRCLAQQGASGVLLVVANYTGDCLNFGLAMERARALGLPVQRVVVGEDCASLGDGGGGAGGAGRRGMCGLLFVYKIAGALAEEGASLDAVQECAVNVVNSMATLGVCLSPCSLPGAGPLFTLGPDEMELGLGVHGEEGVARKKLGNAHEVAEEMVARLAAALSLKEGDRVAALLNNLGGTSQLEQALMSGELHAALERRGLRVERLFPGHLMTSLEMAGVQFSVLRLPEGAKGDEWLAALDAPTDAAGWPGGPLARPSATPATPAPPPLHSSAEEGAGPELTPTQAQLLLRCVCAAADALRGAEAQLNHLDSGCGDGDCGSTLRRLADETTAAVERGELPGSRPARLLVRLSELAENCMGGTSGAVYSLLLQCGARALAAEDDGADAGAWTRALRAALFGLEQYSTARPGDRTLLDALEPACVVLEASRKEQRATLAAAAAAAATGCESTRHMVPRVGRASYVDRQRVQDVDAGAQGVVVWINAVIGELTRH